MGLLKTIDKKYIIFDFDGTLVEADLDWRRLKKELDDLGFEQNLVLSKLPISEKLYYLKSVGLLSSGISAIEKFEKKNINKFTLTADVKNLLKILQASDKKFAIFSDNLKITIVKVLSKESLINLFNPIIGRDDISMYKPYPEGLWRILAEWKATSDDVVYVGDKQKDRAAAGSLKVKYVDISQLKTVG